MSTIANVIAGAFEDLGVIRPGESISGLAIETSAFLTLQERWALASLDRAFVNTIKHQTLTLTAGTSLYTFGTGGTLVATATPIRVTGWAQVLGNIRRGGVPISHEEFAATFKDELGSTSQFVSHLAADNAYPSINIRVGPVPAASPASLILDYWSQMAQFAAVSDSLASLAPGYEVYLRNDLAIGLYPAYKRENSKSLEVLGTNAQNAKQTIMALNASILGLRQAPAPQQGQGGG